MTADQIAQLFPYLIIFLGGIGALVNSRAKKQIANADSLQADAANRAVMTTLANEFVTGLKADNERLEAELHRQAEMCKAQIETMQHEIDELRARLDAREGDGK